ncbi:prolipoprotein diacylglyceryl transferase [Marinicella sp. W31]|uniref:prolipoprotein diacylglyceryl transferase n=1 Tax=Marinicella sp. W31 TaxID=3023713 RepID=UPI0037580DF3
METSRFLIDFNPVFLDLGVFKIHWYGITYLIAFACYWLLGRYRIRHYDTGWNDEQLSDFLFYGALGVIIGGRIGWYLFYNDVPLMEDFWLPIKVWDGGMSFHGGLAGVVIALLYFKNKTKKTFFQVSDFVAPLVPLGIMSVRIGNFVNGELWGRLTEKPWGVIFPQSLPTHIYPQNMSLERLHDLNAQGQLLAFARHPSPLYEAFGEGLMAFIVVWLVAKYSRKAGAASAAFLICYGVARFIVEFFREPDSNRGFIAFDWMTMGQLLTIPLIVAGLAFLLWPKKTA